MWKLSFLKYGNTHLISELYYKIGAFKMSGNCHFQIKWLDNPNIKRWLDVGSSESKAKGSFGQKEFLFSAQYARFRVQ
jgi:hypothetical protein